MYNKGLKAAAKACLQDARTDPKRVVFVYLLVTFLLDVPYSLVSTLFQQAMEGVSAGFGTLRLLSGYYTWFNLAPAVLSIVSLLWTTGFTAYALHLSRGEDAGTGDLLEGFRSFLRVLWLTIREAFFIFLWSCLFVIPGIVAAYRYRMAIYALLEDPDVSAREAMDISKRITRGHKIELLILDLSFWWYYLIGGFIAGIGSADSIAQAMEQYGMAPGFWTALSLWNSFAVYLGAEIALLIFSYFTIGYVNATYAHSYNYLKQLGDERYQGSSYSPL